MPDLQDLEHEFHLWYLPTARFDADRLASRAAEVLSPTERERAGRFAFAKDRRSYILAHWLLRTVLSRYISIPPSQWEFTRSLFGKPKIAGPTEESSLQFNLSHSQGMVACGVTLAGEIGVDVETIRPREWLSLARRFFAPMEADQLERLPAAARGPAFFRLWTQKEAYVKARGQGLSLDLSQFAFPDVMGEEIRIEFGEGWDDAPGDWQFFRHQPDPDHQIAAAVHQARCGKIIWRMMSDMPTNETGAEQTQRRND